MDSPRICPYKSRPMEDVFIPLLIRMLVTAAVVVAATAAAERAGPFYGALIGVFPTSAGPAYVMLALKEDAAFVAASAVASMASMAAIAPFVAVMVWLAPRAGVWTTVGAGLAVWAVFAVPVSQIAWTPMTALAVNAVVYPACFWITRNMGQAPVDRQRQRTWWYTLPLRALVVGLFVGAVVTASHALGPVGTGLGAVFPIVFLSLTVILHLSLGGAAAAATMHKAMRVVSGMVFALMAMHYGVVVYGSAIGLSIGLSVSVTWAVMLVVWNRRRTRRAAGKAPA
jgi:uncharacterized membrane protein (GlpM family)